MRLETVEALRDYFASQVLSALYTEYFAGLRNKEYTGDPGWPIEISVDAYRIADAMLQVRDQKADK